MLICCLFFSTQDQYEDLTAIDVDSSEFKSLPPDIQHEIIMDMKERRKTHKMSRRTVTDLPEVCPFFIDIQFCFVQCKVLLTGEGSFVVAFGGCDA